MTEDQAGALLAGVVVSLASLGVWGMVAAAATGRFPRSALVGLRTPATTESDEAWQEGHRAALSVVRPSCASAAAAAVAGAALGSWPPAGAVLVLVAAGLLAAGAILGALSAHRAARSLSSSA